MRSYRSLGLLAGALVICALGRWAAADWPLGRHDRRRTAQATGRSDIRQPVAYWKRYIGGELDPAAMLVADVDGDGADEVLMIAGGSAVAKTRGDAVVWRSENLELHVFIGVADIDGEPGEELLARSRDRAYVLSLSDGSVLWAEPAGEMGTIGGTRLGDVDGDRLPDLIVVECACCTVLGENPGFAYSFARGASQPRRLWRFASARCAGQDALTLADVDGRGGLEVVQGDLDALVLLSGVDGSELGRSPAVGSQMQRSRCVAANIDAIRGEELICLYDADWDPQDNQRAVFALRFQPASGQLALLWSRALAPVADGALSSAGLVADLDGDAIPEVVVSSLQDSAWTTHVLSAASGTTIDTVSGEIAVGSVPVGDGAVLLTSSESHLSGWRLDGSRLALRWTVFDATLAQTVDLARAARSSIAGSPVVARIDGDEVADIITVQRSQPGSLVAYSIADNDIREIARRQLGPTLSVEHAWPLESATSPDLRLAVASSDGYLLLFEEGLAAASTANDDVKAARLRTGGYYASGWRRINNTLRSARLDDGPERLLLVDSRRTLQVLDAELGSFAAPPRVLWEVPGGLAPAVVEHLDGQRPAVVCTAVDQPPTTPATFSLLALDGSGGTLWRQPAPAKPLNDVVPGSLDGDGVPDLVFEWGAPGDILLRTRAVSGASGVTLWDSEPVDPGAGRQPAGVALADFDGDGVDDVYHQVRRTQVLSGSDGSQLASTPDGPNYFLPTLADVDGDQAPEVILHGGPEPVRVLDDDLTSTLFTSADDNRPYPYGALADCGDRQLLVSGSNMNSARLKLTVLSGDAIGGESTLVLAGGVAYADESAAATTGAFLGQLTSPTVHQDLTGLGRPSAVVGSTDGWLYAIDPCSAQLDFAYEFGAAVGEAIFGDTDGDGRDEILVTVEDGYVYTLRNFEIDAPPEVLDTDPWSDAAGDIGELHTDSTLEVTWTPVAGAVGYQVAVVDEAGNYVGTPWRDAGPGTTFLLSDLELEDDAVYRVSVRAVAADGEHSVDTVSNGVWVHLLPADGPSRTGCCNSGGGLADAGSGLLLLAVVGLLRRRRAR